jgi:hypothetical protein
VGFDQGADGRQGQARRLNDEDVGVLWEVAGGVANYATGAAVGGLVREEFKELDRGGVMTGGCGSGGVRGWSFKGADEGAKTFDLIGSQADADARFGIVAHEHIAKDRSPVSQERALCADGKREDGVAARAGDRGGAQAAGEEEDARDHRGSVPEIGAESGTKEWWYERNLLMP